MKALNHIAFVRGPGARVHDFLVKVQNEGFSCEMVDADSGFVENLDRISPAAVVLDAGLGQSVMDKSIHLVKERFAHIPVILLYDHDSDGPCDQPALPSDGVCFTSMSPACLAIALRGAIRAGFTIQELVASNRLLNEISITDSLTGLYNRGYMIDRLNLEFKRTARNREILSCLMVDLDHFKQINDTYGHKFGDVILESVSARLTGLIRETDIFGRYGGEEFLIVLPNTNLDGAMHLAEKLRAGLESEKITHDCFSLLVTASFGVASSENTEVITADHLLQLSDRALYAAKESGRNRVCAAGVDDRKDSSARKAAIADRRTQAGKSEIHVISARGADNPRIRALLENGDYRVSLHKTPSSFLEMFQTHAPDLLVVDSGNGEPSSGPGAFDTFAFCERIKRQSQDIFLPLVVVFSEPDEALRDKALKAGADDVVMHPLEDNEFITRLQSMIHLKALHDRWRGTYRDLTMARTRLVKVERLTALGEMASGVAHDFNNILSAILGRAQILRRDAKDPKILKNLEIIEKAASDGAATIRRIQEFARSTSDRVYENVDMGQVLQDCIQMTRTRWKDQAEMDGVHFGFHVDIQGPLYVKGSATELREVITNLIMNALDAMPRGGEMRFEGKINGDEVLISIQDSGAGMSEEVQKRIFDPFFSTKKGEGTGLGLSVAYGIIVRHNGRIECVSKLDEGTTFFIHLPHEWVDVPTRQATPAPVDQRRPRVRACILVVDDETPIREIIRDVLEPEGHEVLLAETGQKALDIIRDHNVQVLFTDLSMPGMSGWEVARQARKIKPDLEIIMTSGWGKDFNQQQLTTHGVDHVLPKPVPFEALQSIGRQLARGDKIKMPV
jgi:diguanylate cyclase (GGDEF)-like protein